MYLIVTQLDARLIQMRSSEIAPPLSKISFEKDSVIISNYSIKNNEIYNLFIIFLHSFFQNPFKICSLKFLKSLVTIYS